jgi:hypothetical protein
MQISYIKDDARLGKSELGQMQTGTGQPAKEMKRLDATTHSK